MNAGYIVWFKPRRGVPWVQVGEPGTHWECVSLIGTGDRKGGMWWIRRLTTSEPDGVLSETARTPSMDHVSDLLTTFRSD